MKIKDIAKAIEAVAPLCCQEGYDNAGIQVGDAMATVTGVLLCTDVSMAVVDEAIERGCNLVVSHHPLIFKGLKKIAGRTQVERIVAHAIKHDIAIYSAHTNMDNVPGGVSFKMAEKLGMTDVEVLDAHCDGDTPTGSGVVGAIKPMPAVDFLRLLKATFEVGAVRYSGDTTGTITRVALCGGAGGFLIDNAVAAGAQVFVTADMRYHDFLENNDRLLLVDIGHYESEHFTKEIFSDIIMALNPDFPVASAKNEKNQIQYI